MKDYNFFEYYLEKKHVRNLKYLYIAALFLLALGIVGGTYFWGRVETEKIEEVLALQEENIDLKKIEEQENEINHMKKELGVLKKYIDSVNLVERTIIGSDRINAELINKIANVVPREITLKSMDINNKTLNIEGNSKDRVNVAELEYNIKNLKIFKTVHVSYVDDENAKEEAEEEESQVNTPSDSEQEDVPDNGNHEELNDNNTDENNIENQDSPVIENEIDITEVVQNEDKGYSFTIECTF